MRRIDFTCDICDRSIDAHPRVIGKQADGTEIMSMEPSFWRLTLAQVGTKTNYPEKELSIDLCEYHYDMIKTLIENERKGNSNGIQ